MSLHSGFDGYLEGKSYQGGGGGSRISSAKGSR
jgi:hypothetical protein